MVEPVFSLGSEYIEAFKRGKSGMSWKEFEAKLDVEYRYRRRAHRNAFVVGKFFTRKCIRNAVQSFPDHKEIWKSLDHHGISEPHFWLADSIGAPWGSGKDLSGSLHRLPKNVKNKVFALLLKIADAHPKPFPPSIQKAYALALGHLADDIKQVDEVRALAERQNKQEEFSGVFISTHRLWTPSEIIKKYIQTEKDHLNHVSDLEQPYKCEPYRKNRKYLEQILKGSLKQDKGNNSDVFKFFRPLSKYSWSLTSPFIKDMLEFAPAEMRDRFFLLAATGKIHFKDSRRDVFWVLFNHWHQQHRISTRFFSVFRKELKDKSIDGALVRQWKNYRSWYHENADEEILTVKYALKYNPGILDVIGVEFKTENAQLAVLRQCSRAIDCWKVMRLFNAWAENVTVNVMEAFLRLLPKHMYWDDFLNDNHHRIVSRCSSKQLPKLYVQSRNKAVKECILARPMSRKSFESILRFEARRDKNQAALIESSYVNMVHENETLKSLLWRVRHPGFLTRAAETAFNSYHYPELHQALSERKWEGTLNSRIDAILRAKDAASSVLGQDHSSVKERSTIQERLLPYAALKSDPGLTSKIANLKSFLDAKAQRLHQGEIIGVLRTAEQSSVQTPHNTSRSGDSLRLFWGLVTRGNQQMMDDAIQVVGKEGLFRARSALSNKDRVALFQWATGENLPLSLSGLLENEVSLIEQKVIQEAQRRYGTLEVVWDLFDQVSGGPRGKVINDGNKNCDMKFGGADLAEMLIESRDVGCCYFYGGARAANFLPWFVNPDAFFIYIVPVRNTVKQCRPIGVVMCLMVDHGQTMVVDSVEGKFKSLQQFPDWERHILDTVVRAAQRLNVSKVLFNESVGNAVPRAFIKWCQDNKIGHVKSYQGEWSSDVKDLDYEWRAYDHENGKFKCERSRIVMVPRPGPASFTALENVSIKAAQGQPHDDNHTEPCLDRAMRGERHVVNTVTPMT